MKEGFPEYARKNSVEVNLITTIGVRERVLASPDTSIDGYLHGRLIIEVFAWAPILAEKSWILK